MVGQKRYRSDLVPMLPWDRRSFGSLSQNQGDLGDFAISQRSHIDVAARSPLFWFISRPRLSQWDIADNISSKNDVIILKSRRHRCSEDDVTANWQRYRWDCVMLFWKKTISQRVRDDIFLNRRDNEITKCCFERMSRWVCGDIVLRRLSDLAASLHRCRRYF